MEEKLEKNEPIIGRNLEILDVAKTIALLGLSNNSWLTGNTIRVDGGEDITG